METVAEEVTTSWPVVTGTQRRHSVARATRSGNVSDGHSPVVPCSKATSLPCATQKAACFSTCATPASEDLRLPDANKPMSKLSVCVSSEAPFFKINKAFIRLVRVWSLQETF